MDSLLTVAQGFHLLGEELEHGRTLDVSGIQADESIVLVVEAEPELNWKTSDDVRIEFRCQHCIVKKLNRMIFLHTLKERFQVFDLWN